MRKHHRCLGRVDAAHALDSNAHLSLGRNFNIHRLILVPYQDLRIFSTVTRHNGCICSSVMMDSFFQAQKTRRKIADERNSPGQALCRSDTVKNWANNTNRKASLGFHDIRWTKARSCVQFPTRYADVFGPSQVLLNFGMNHRVNQSVGEWLSLIDV